MEARRRNRTVFAELDQRPRNKERLAAVTHWRLALWQPWREQQNMPARVSPKKQSLNLISVATWNINGFSSKRAEMEDFMSEQKVAMLALQEMLVKASHYQVHMNGYKVYQNNAGENF